MKTSAIMRRLTFFDMELGFENLFTARKLDLERSASGRLYGPILSKRYLALQALPEVLRGKKPLAAEFDATDERHDRYGAGTLGYIEAVLSIPNLSDATRAAATRIRESFIPERKKLGESYVAEATAARKNRPKLVELEADLKAFPTPEGKTLYDWVSAFLDEGDNLAKLLEQRSQAATGSAGNAGKLRGEIIGLLYQFRASLQTEIEEDQSLPRDLEDKVFSYFDELNGRHRAGKKAAAEEQPQGSEGGE